MDRLIDAIPAGTTVGIDTPLFIYHLEAHPLYGPVVGPFMEALEQGVVHGVTSTITLMEIVVRPLQLERPEVADDYELLLLGYPNLAIVPIDREAARLAAELRARYRLSPADSLQIAAAIGAGAETLINNDRALSRLTAIRVLVLDDFVR